MQAGRRKRRSTYIYMSILYSDSLDFAVLIILLHWVTITHTSNTRSGMVLFVRKYNITCAYIAKTVCKRAMLGYTNAGAGSTVLLASALGARGRNTNHVSPFLTKQRVTFAFRLAAAHPPLHFHAQVHYAHEKSTARQHKDNE